MKALHFVIVIAALAATTPPVSSIEQGNELGTGEEVPTIPGDNSHYVDGVSRYIWYPDGDGNPILVDLQEPVDQAALQQVLADGAKNQYWLFTRENPHKYQLLVNGDKNSVTQSNYRSNKATKVIVHGWRSKGSAPINTLNTAAFLKNEDCNVIVVDWSKVAGGINYPGAAAAVPNIGQYVGNFLIWLFDNVGGNWGTLHLTGHSLGAHVVGNAGRTAGARPKRITGMDPAGPLWKDNPKSLGKGDGQYVEAIHTDAGLLGLYKMLGNADFYPNGGKGQPGCWLNVCSHSRAYELFASTVENNHLVGKACKDLDEAKAKKCSGAEFHMGNDVITKSGNGLYGLATGADWPY